MAHPIFNPDTKTAFTVQAGDIISVNGGHDFLKVWSVATLRNGANVGIRFEERDSSGRRLYVNLKSYNTVYVKTA